MNEALGVGLQTPFVHLHLIIQAKLGKGEFLDGMNFLYLR